MSEREPSAVDRVTTLLALLAVVVLGLSAGAMYTEAHLLVPYWRSMPPQDFLSWFASNEPRLVAFFAPLQETAAVLSLAVTALLAARRRRGAGLFAASTLLSLAAIATYFLYFQSVNAAFVAGSLATAEVAPELARWGAWQWLRTGIGMGAFLAALLALRQRSS